MPTDRQKLKSYLVLRAEAHFGEESEKKPVYEAAADLLMDDRETAQKNQWEPYPGLAEYLDLLRALENAAKLKPSAKIQKLDDLKDFFLRKHPDFKTGS